MDKYKFLLEGIEVSNPNGWDKFELRLKRDDDIAGLLISSTNKFTFKGDGYDIIKDRFDNNYNDKINATIEVLEDNTYTEKYKGVIILTDVLFNLEKRTAQTTIEDASFQGAIQANKNVKSFLNAGMTKNGEQVTSLTIYNLDYFNAVGAPLSLANRRAYLLKDALDFMVRFMTDDTVKGIQSDYLDDTANFDGYLPYITTGEAIRLANSDAPNVSFSELMTFLQRTHDLTFDFVTVSGEIVMRIEDRAFFFQSDITDTFRDLTDLSLNVDAQKIASHLEVGNNTTADAGNCSLTTRFFSFQEEDYALKGKGNVDKLIDLKTDFVTDSNVIQYIVTNLGDDEFDDNIVIVQASTTQAARFQSTSYCSNNYYYNASFTNDKIIDRNLNAIPNSVTKYLTAATTPAKIGLQVNEILFDDPSLFNQTVPKLYNKQRVKFDNESSPYYDLGGRYFSTPDNQGNAYYYEIPFVSTFNFSYKLAIKIDADISFGTGVPPLEFDQELEYTFKVFIQHQDGSFNLEGEKLKEINVRSIPNSQGTSTLKYQGAGGNTIPGNILIIEDATSFVCSTSARISLKLDMFLTSPHGGGFTMTLLEPSSFFKCDGATSDAGTYKEFDPNSFKARLFKFRKNVSLQRSDNIRENTRSSFIINELSDTDLDKTVWIEEVVNNVETGETSFTMIN